MIAALILLHIALGLVVLGLNNRVGRRGFAVVALAPLATLIWLSAHVSDVIDGTVVIFRLEWVAKLGLTLDFRLNGLSLVMLILVSGIGLLVCWYALAYFDDAKPALGRLAGLMTIFAGSMIGKLNGRRIQLTSWPSMSTSRRWRILNRSSSLRRVDSQKGSPSCR